LKTEKTEEEEEEEEEGEEAKMILQFFVLSQRGDNIVYRDCECFIFSFSLPFP